MCLNPIISCVVGYFCCNTSKPHKAKNSTEDDEFSPDSTEDVDVCLCVFFESSRTWLVTNSCLFFANKITAELGHKCLAECQMNLKSGEIFFEKFISLLNIFLLLVTVVPTPANRVEPRTQRKDEFSPDPTEDVDLCLCVCACCVYSVNLSALGLVTNLRIPVFLMPTKSQLNADTLQDVTR